jgi:hypothetical protein
LISLEFDIISFSCFLAALCSGWTGLYSLLQ